MLNVILLTHWTRQQGLHVDHACFLMTPMNVQPCYSGLQACCRPRQIVTTDCVKTEGLAKFRSTIQLRFDTADVLNRDISHRNVEESTGFNPCLSNYLPERGFVILYEAVYFTRDYYKNHSPIRLRKEKNTEHKKPSTSSRANFFVPNDGCFEWRKPTRR